MDGNVAVQAVNEVFSLLESQEVVYGFTETSVGRWEYVTAYRRLTDGDIIGAQVPLEAGTSALQATDLIELLGLFCADWGLVITGTSDVCRPSSHSTNSCSTNRF